MNVTDIIRNNIETSEPHASIVEFLKTKEGKRIDKRLLASLMKEFQNNTMYFSQVGSLHYLNWKAEGKCRQEGRLLLSYNAKNIDTDDIVQENPAYFQGSLERNRHRQSCLNPEHGRHAATQNLQETLNNYVEILKQAEEIRCQLADMISDYPDKYQILDQANLKDIEEPLFIRY